MPAFELSADHETWLTKMSEHLKREGYSREGRYYASLARKFLHSIQTRSLTIHDVEPAYVERYLNNLRCVGQSGRKKRASIGQREYCRAALHMLLQIARGRWPPEAVAIDEQSRFRQQLIQGYSAWMMGLRGLRSTTCSLRCANALMFLEWLGKRGSENPIGALTVDDIDAYIQWRLPSLRRVTRLTVTVHLRSFLRYLHSAGRIPDLAPRVIVPKVYENEDIPSALRPEEVDKVLQSVREDDSPIGLRDYAILLLLSTYGLRASEITALRLDDVDWKHDRLRIYHSKTGVHSELPLLREPGEAIINYLRRGRPKTNQREIFIRTCAPYRALTGPSLHTILQPRLVAAGVVPKGKRGPHAFRHARAVSLLRSAVPLKVIGDVLAHRSPASTMTYLKLDYEELRGIGLEVPGTQS
jgi:integrase/recombinase XerD